MDQRKYLVPWLAMPALIILMIAYFYAFGKIAYDIGVRFSLSIAIVTCWLVLVRAFWNIGGGAGRWGRGFIAAISAAICTVVVIVLAYYGALLVA